MTELLKVTFAMISEGLKVFGEERRTRFQDKYYKLQMRLNKSLNARDADYLDYEIDIIKSELEIYVSAYYKELKDHNNENHR